MRWRSFLVVVMVAVVGGGIALEFAARKAAVDLTHAFEPLATLSYASAGLAFDGSLRLEQPRLTIHRGIWQGEASARLADLRDADALWLVWRSLTGDSAVPADLRVRTRGLHLGQRAGESPFLSGWIGTSDLALFENLGCGSDALSDKDRTRMGVDTLERLDQFEFHYDAARKSLNASFALRSESIADIEGFFQISGLDLARRKEAAALATARLSRAGISYADSGYFSRRNQFCAQWLGSSAADFVAHHVGAVTDFLSARGIVPGKELLALYQRLVTQGGTLTLTSLPDASWIPAQIGAYPRAALLRQLNITARLEDAPPIMLRLAFSDPEAPLTVAEAPLVAAAPTTPAAPVENDPPPASAPVEAQATTARPVATRPVVEPRQPDDVAATVLQPAPPDIVSYPSSPSVAPLPEVSILAGERRVIASAPPPPKDSTLALVWKPGVIERLPAQPATKPRYVVVPASQLGSMIRADVRIITANGKRVDGRVKEVVGDHVVLEVQVTQGDAELNVPLDRIREVRVAARDVQ